MTSIRTIVRTLRWLALPLIGLALHAAVPAARLEIGLKADDPWRGPVPHPFVGDRPTWSNPWFQLGSGFRESLLQVQVDTLGHWEVYAFYRPDGTKVGETLVDGAASLERRVQLRNPRALNKALTERAMQTSSGGSDHVEIDIPFKVRSQTFRRIFGSGRIGLNVTGSISIAGEYHTEKNESESASAINTNSNDFRLDQQQQFTVVGKIGEKVDVHIDQDTERSFDFENNLSIVYTGEPEEVIESIEAGNISLSLPGTRYVSFNDKSSGLFGLKMVTRLGPLRMTGIASSEKNESKQQTFEGGTSTSTLSLGPGDHNPNIFYINEFYRHQARLFSADLIPLNDPRARIRTFKLYRLDTSTNNHASVKLVSPYGVDLLDGQLYSVKEIQWDATNPPASFDLDVDRGIVTLNGTVPTTEFVGMSYTVADGAVFTEWFNEFGSGPDNSFTTGTENPVEGSPVVVLVPDHFGPESGVYWDLQARNVFRAGNAGLDPNDFQLDIVKQVSGGSSQNSQNGVNYLRIFYLDVLNAASSAPGNDGRVDARNLDPETGLLTFPSPAPFSDRPQDWVLQYTGTNDLAESLAAAGYPLAALYEGYARAPNQGSGGTFDEFVPFNEAEDVQPLYDLRPRSAEWTALNSLYALESEATTGTETISLGWNVTNVTVTANGRRLAEGSDYSLDELSGLIRITNPAYTRPDQKIVVSYETPQLFQLRKKTFMGVKADLDLWRTGSRVSRLGAAAIYYNEETAERKIRLGNEPIKNVVLDLNTELHFAPRQMTDWMDALPLIEADEPSSLDFEAEYAMVLPDPNPTNNPDTGDPSGVAYVDDFESSKQEIPLSLGHGQWSLSSTPAGELLGHRGRLRWKNPTDKIEASEIWPEYRNSDREGVSNQIRVLRAFFEPFRLAGDEEAQEAVGGPLARTRSWDGFYYDFRGAYDDFTEKKFIEITMKVDGDRSGELHVDLGRMGEDVIPDGAIDTEDADYNQILEASDDIGLDGMAGPDPPWPLTPELYSWSGTPEEMEAHFGIPTAYDWWDLDRDGVRDPHESWSFDDYSRDPGDDPALENSHGTEGNSQDLDQRGPDSEDRNNDRRLNEDEDYFAYRVPLDRSDPDYERYVDEKEGSEWFKVTIPLRDSRMRSVGSPLLTVVEGLRIWLTGFDGPVTVQIAELSISGTEWQEAIVAESDTSHHEITVLNNFDNDEYYSPKGVSGQLDRITGVEAREQSLVLQLEDLPYGETAWIRKQLAVPASLTEYRELKMYVRGGGNNPQAEGGDDSLAYADRFGDETLELLVRIQSTEGNYYEYSKPIRAGWDPANEMRIVFDEITGIEAFSAASREQEEPEKPVLLSDGGLMRVVGNPSINQVRALLFGVKNHGSRPARTQVWFNELRVSDVKKEIGRAFRVSGTAAFSDVLTLSSSYEEVDAEYHTVKERIKRTGSETFKRNFSVSGSTDLGRLLPPAAGVSARLQADANRNYQLPKFYPNDDQEVDPLDHPEWVETLSRSRGATLTLRKTGSKSAWFKHTLDKLNFSTSLSETVKRDRRILADTTVQQSFSLTYGNNFTWQHRLKPFSFVEEWPVVHRLSELEIGYVPTNLSLGGRTSRTLRHQYNRDASVLHTQTYTLNRNWSTSLPLFNDFTVSGGRNYSNNLLFARDQARVPTARSWNNALLEQQYEAFVARLLAWQEKDASLFDGDDQITQNVDFNFRPTLIPWLSTDFSYGTTYGWRRDLANPVNGVSVTNGGNFRADFKLKATKLAQTLLFMSDASLNEAKRELGELKDEREADRDARREERRLRREARKAERDSEDAADAALEDAPAEGGGPGEDAAAEAVPGGKDAAPGADGSPGAPEPEPEPEPAPLVPPAAPAPAPAPAPALVETPAAGDSLGAASEEPPRRSELENVLAGLEGLPDSLRRQIEIADSLVRAGGGAFTLADAADSSATEVAEASPDTLAAEPEPNALLEALGRAFRRARQRAVVSTTVFDDFSIGFKRTSGQDDPGLAIYPWTPLSSRHASLPYQLALRRDPGLDTLRIGSLNYRTTRNFGYDYNLGTRVNLIPSVPVRLRYDYAFNQRYSDEREESRSEKLTGWYSFENEGLLGGGKFAEGDAIGGNPALLALPDYGLSVQGLQRLPVVKNFVKSLTLSHEYNGGLDVTYGPSSAGMKRNSLSFTKNFAPLAGFDFQLEKGWGGALNVNLRRTLTVNDPDGEQRKATHRLDREWSISGSKALRKGFRLPGFRKRIENDTTLRLTYRNNAGRNVATALRAADAEPGSPIRWNRPTSTANWSLEASADMTFSRYVTGGASWEYGVRTSSEANTRSSYMDFGVHCRIQIRSR